MSYERNRQRAIDSVCEAFFGKGLNMSTSDKVKLECMIDEFDLTVGDIPHDETRDLR